MGFHITSEYSLLQDLSVRTKIFDLVTLISNFGELEKKNYFWIERDPKRLKSLSRGISPLLVRTAPF